MSDILIKGMEMPKRMPIKAVIFPDGRVTVTLHSGKILERKAVHVPKHGRLIDADALKLSHCKECTLYPDKCLEKTDEGCDWGSIYHIEHCAPTIIEAEEGE